jgi:hypothetical protein
MHIILSINFEGFYSRPRNINMVSFRKGEKGGVPRNHQNADPAYANIFIIHENHVINS